MSPVGLERSDESSGNNAVSKKTDAESDALRRDLPPELAKIIAAWPNLPEPIRRAMLALIGSGALLSPCAVLADWRGDSTISERLIWRLPAEAVIAMRTAVRTIGDE